MAMDCTSGVAKGKPIFSVDIHPDGSRFATGGQGDDCGRIVIWNMLPVRSAEAENDDKIPKILCQMANHQGCVNCVRWSHDGRYLASVGDDKLVMIWQISRQGNMGSMFGSEVVNHEHWRATNVLRGHGEDVLDVAWSPHDAWLASCSVDNTVIVWNALKLPEQLAILRGHSGLVKGVTWDPVGKYLASQSDDKTLRIWRTSDWKQEACISEPFKECCGTTHVLRLNWSPDGHHVVSAHAMNNSGPTAQIVERDQWKTRLDFVGHRKAVTCVRFNSNIFRKKIKKKDTAKEQQYSCVAIGSRDRTVSVWLTALKRPLVLTRDLFENSILDLSWGAKTLELLSCSADGTVAYMSFNATELGTPISRKEKDFLFKTLYGNSLLSAKNVNANSQQVIESIEMLKIQKQRAKEEQQRKAIIDASNKSSFSLQAVTPRKSCTNSNTFGSAPMTPTTKQIETRTKDGRRRITPIFLSATPEVGDVPRPFHTSTEPMFSSSKEQSTIVREKIDSISPPVFNMNQQRTSNSGSNHSSKAPATPATPAPAERQAALAKAQSNAATPVSQSNATTSVPPTASQPSHPAPTQQSATQKAAGKSQSTDKVVIHTAKRKLDADLQAAAAAAHEPAAKRKENRGRPRKSLEHAAHRLTPAHTPVVTSKIVEKETKIIYTNAGLDLPVPAVLKTAHVQVYGPQGATQALFVNIANHVSVSSAQLHQLQAVCNGVMVWQSLLNSAILACTGNKHFVCAACVDKTLHLLSSTSGSRLLPTFVLDAKIHKLRCSGYYVLAVTSRGTLYVWNMKTKAVVINKESISTIVPDNSTQIVNILLTEYGLPIVALSNGTTYTFKKELCCWVVLSSKDDSLHLCSDHYGSTPTPPGQLSGPLTTLQAGYKRDKAQTSRLHKAVSSTSTSTLTSSATLSHLESQVNSALVLQSGSEYYFWLMTYVRYLTQEAMEERLRDVCSELTAPTYRSLTSPWQPRVLGHDKRTLFNECLTIIGSNLQLQRLFTELKDSVGGSK